MLKSLLYYAGAGDFNHGKSLTMKQLDGIFRSEKYKKTADGKTLAKKGEWPGVGRSATINPFGKGGSADASIRQTQLSGYRC
jgi:hypothetical protein